MQHILAMGHTSSQPHRLFHHRRTLCPILKTHQHLKFPLSPTHHRLLRRLHHLLHLCNESLQMLQNGNIGGFITYILLSLIAGLALVTLGYWIIK